MLRSILAVFLGYVAMAVATMIGLVPLALIFHLPLNFEHTDAAPPTAYVAANLVFALPCAMLGGYVAARLARRTPRRHAQVLAAIVLLIGIAYAAQMRGGPQPDWYLALLPVVGAVGVVFGGMLRRPSISAATS